MTHKKPRILVVDDHENSRQVLRKILQPEGYEIEEAVNGDEALVAIKRDCPDLMLLDVIMPVRNGLEVLEELQKFDHPFLPVIVQTVAFEREVRIKALGLGAHDILNKPLDPFEVSIRVRAMLNLKAEHDAAEKRSEDLELLVSERTRQLEKSYESCLETEHFKNNFLSVISHELRTPLNFIMGFASILDDELLGPVPQPQRECLKKILYGTDRMMSVVNNLVDMSWILAGKFQLAPAMTDYLPIVNEVISILRSYAAEKRITLEVDVQATGEIEIDGERVSRVLSNLLENAIKFTPEEGTVRLKARRIGGELMTEVSDTGIGITPEDLPNLFKPFSQLDMSSTRRYGGTGLGLSISKAVVDAHGGQIGVISELGKGSTFWFSLPVRAPSLVHQAPMDVLVVGDDPNNTEVIMYLFTSLGHTVMSVAEGSEAIRLCCGEGRHFAVILINGMLMREMDGLETTRRLRECPQAAGSNIILVLPMGNGPDRKEGLAAGADAVLTKPMKREEMAHYLSKAFVTRSS